MPRSDTGDGNCRKQIGRWPCFLRYGRLSTEALSTSDRSGEAGLSRSGGDWRAGIEFRVQIAAKGPEGGVPVDKTPVLHWAMIGTRVRCN